MKFKFSKSMKVIFNKDKIILGNVQNGYWICMSREVYDLFKMCIVNNYSKEEFIDALYDDEDRKYINIIYNNLQVLGILDEEDNQVVKNYKAVTFEITHSCNLKCVHCCVEAESLVNNKQDLSTDQIKSIFIKIINWNPERIILSGGEPMTRKDWIELIKYLKMNYNGKIVFCTNGTLINKDSAVILSECCDQIDISLDGVDEETCSKIRGIGVYDKVIKSIKLLKSIGFEKITLSLTISDNNAYLKESFNKLNEELGTKPIIRGFSAVGRGKENKSVFSKLSNNEVFVSENYLDEIYTKPIGMYNCKAGKQKIFIRYNGEVYPCPITISTRFYMGNILEVDKIENIEGFRNAGSEGLNLLTTVEKMKEFKMCIKCNIKLFCWCCPGQFLELCGNKHAIWDRCKKIKPMLYKRVWGEELK